MVICDAATGRSPFVLEEELPWAAIFGRFSAARLLSKSLPALLLKSIRISDSESNVW